GDRRGEEAADAPPRRQGRGCRNSLRSLAVAGPLQWRHRRLHGAAHGTGAARARSRRLLDRAGAGLAVADGAAHRGWPRAGDAAGFAQRHAGAAGRARPQRARRRDPAADAPSAGGDEPLFPGAGAADAAHGSEPDAGGRSLADDELARPAKDARPRARHGPHRRPRPGARAAVATAADAGESAPRPADAGQWQPEPDDEPDAADDAPAAAAPRPLLQPIAQWPARAEFERRCAAAGSAPPDAQPVDAAAAAAGWTGPAGYEPRRARDAWRRRGFAARPAGPSRGSAIRCARCAAGGGTRDGQSDARPELRRRA